MFVLGDQSWIGRSFKQVFAIYLVSAFRQITDVGGEVDPISKTQIGSSDCHVRATAPSPLERRVSRCDMGTVLAPCPGTVAEPRKSFMKLCVTDAMVNSRRPVQ